ncbi:MAG: aminotransferase class I/II-fold pyridoxal phosphate-dependent enzyme [Planctomycetota bacterium]
MESKSDLSTHLDSQRGFSTRSVHAGEARQKAGDAITDAIYCSSTFTFQSNQEAIDYNEKKIDREEYGRYGNPNERVLERKLAELDGGEAALVFTTGMSAIITLFMAKLSAGDEIVFFDECYHRSREFCLSHLARFGVKTKQVKTGDYDAFEAAITPATKMLVSESPTNPHLSVVDVERFAAIGRRHRVDTVIDATIATPYNLQPLAAGVDYVAHSATKYLGGHNDLLAGVVVGSKEKLEPVRYLRGIMGTINSPHNCYLLQRGLKTFALRMAQHNRNGLALAEFLASHPKVERVYYPGIPSHPTYAIAKQTMKGFGGLLTFTVRGDASTASKLVDSVTIPRIGPSLGGVESLIEQPLVMSYYQMTPEQRAKIGIEDAMVRVALGIEDTDDLIADFKQALEKI